MSPNYHTNKVNKKQRRCEAIIAKDFDIKSSEVPTRFLGLLNAGTTTGLTEERVLAAASPHGEVTQLLLLPSKSYAFLSCASPTDAEQILQALHNRATIGQNGAVVFVSFFERLPPMDNAWTRPTPPGLLVLPDFVSAAEEERLLAALGLDKEQEQEATAALKHRQVKHFGFEFLYGTNDVNADLPLPQGIPPECDVLWPRLKTALIDHGVHMEWEAPDQLTVNSYTPGQGIPPHVDTHSAFLDPILSLSLVDDVVMEFRRGVEHVPVVLPRLSLLVMSGESRFDWTHGITPRVLDVVPTVAGALTTRRRNRRTSLTFRRLRRAPCHCDFPTHCNTRRQAATNERPAPMADDVAVTLEAKNVHRVYEEIASHFSETRHTPWPRVAEFLYGFDCGAVLLDVGCGNGKYLGCNPAALAVGCDRSQGLLAVCAGKGRNVFRCDCLRVPFRSGAVDGCLSIAVVHHLATPERRLAALREMARVLRPGGRALVYVWARNQRSDDDQRSSYLRQNKAVNKRRTTEEQQRQIIAQQLQACETEGVALPIHTNRTEFLQQDVLVPWQRKAGRSTEQPEAPATFLRYYHVFEAGELEALVASLEGVRLLRSYYDQGNHCVVFERVEEKGGLGLS